MEHSKCLNDRSAVETVSASPSRMQRDKIEFMLFEIPAFPSAFNALIMSFKMILEAYDSRVMSHI